MTELREIQVAWNEKSEQHVRASTKADLLRKLTEAIAKTSQLPEQGLDLKPMLFDDDAGTDPVDNKDYDSDGTVDLQLADAGGPIDAELQLDEWSENDE